MRTTDALAKRRRIAMRRTAIARRLAELLRLPVLQMERIVWGIQGLPTEDEIVAAVRRAQLEGEDLVPRDVGRFLREARR